MTLTLASGRALTLSPRHFIPVAAGADGAWDARVAKGADEVRVGDFVWSAAGEGRMAVDEVVAVATRAAAGAYNPLTLNGTIVVDGVVASAHSDWFLDGVVRADTQARVYQAILAPVRVAYRAMGPAWMEAVIERWGVVDLVRESTTPGGRGARPAWALLALPICSAAGCSCGGGGGLPSTSGGATGPRGSPAARLCPGHAVISGGTSGIGLALARQLASAGWDLTILAGRCRATRAPARKTRSSAASASASVAISRARSSSATVPPYIDARGPERRR